ncbi:MAG: dTMP kinase [Magnetospirillum sp. WYHS-4]
MTRGRFITFEGGEGAGKSTQVARLAEFLRGRGLEVVTTREPGGSPGAEEIRRLLVEGHVARWQGLTEALLNYAARYEHMEAAILPALAAGKWVISDRFADSTLAYQGYGHRLDLDLIARLHRLVVGDFAPDLTLIFDLPVEVGLARTRSRPGVEDRYERMDESFHRRLRQGFLDIAAAHPERCLAIDAAADPDTVALAVRRAVADRLGIGN